MESEDTKGDRWGRKVYQEDRLHEVPQGKRLGAGWRLCIYIYHILQYGEFFYNFCDGVDQGKVIMKIEFGG
jgi:hypothetical protein